MALVNYSNEYSRLKKVILYRPRIAEIENHNPQKAMYISLPDAQKVLNEFDSIVRKLESLDIEVIVLEGNKNSVLTSNMIYLRDVATVFRDKVIISRMKHEIRQNEPEKLMNLLINNNSKFEETFICLSNGTIEGADIFVINSNLIYVYIGNRTNCDAVQEIATLYPELEVKLIKAKINNIPQHILGGVHIVNKDLIIRRTQYCKDMIQDYKSVDFVEDIETASGFALNFLTISPNEILMPSNRPKTKKILEDYRIKCHEVDIDEIHKMGGGLACMVLPILRES